MHATSHVRESIFADPVLRVPESDKRVATADSEEVTVGRVLETVGSGGVCWKCVKERLMVVSEMGYRRCIRNGECKIHTILGQSMTLTVPSPVVAKSSLPE